MRAVQYDGYSGGAAGLKVSARHRRRFLLASFSFRFYLIKAFPNRKEESGINANDSLLGKSDGS
jgi:hypothetical protein